MAPVHRWMIVIGIALVCVVVVVLFWLLYATGVIGNVLQLHYYDFGGMYFVLVFTYLSFDELRHFGMTLLEDVVAFCICTAMVLTAAGFIAVAIVFVSAWRRCRS